MIENKQGFLFVVFILAILVIGFAYVILSKPLGISYDKYYNSSYTENQEYQNFYIRSKTVWDFLLVPIAFGLIFYIIIEIQRKNNAYGEV